LEWVKLAKSQKVDLPEDFSWYALSSGIISRVRALVRDGNFESLAVWFKILNEIYDKVATGHPDSSESEAVQFEIMHIRATLIMKFGVIKSESLLDEHSLLTWFFHDLTIPLDIAIRKSDDWQKLKQEKKVKRLRDNGEVSDDAKQIFTIEDLIILRKIKNKLSVLKPLYQNKLIENKELGEWISIMYKLP
jgi:hypothetical protein